MKGESLENASLKLTDVKVEMEAVQAEDESEPTTAVAAIPSDVAAVEVISVTEEVTKSHEIEHEEITIKKFRTPVWCRVLVALTIALIMLAIYFLVKLNMEAIQNTEEEATTTIAPKLTTVTHMLTTATERPYSYSNDDDDDAYSDEEYFQSNGPDAYDADDDDEYNNDPPYIYENYASVENITAMPDAAYYEENIFDSSENDEKLQIWSDCSLKRNFTLWPNGYEPTLDDVFTTHYLNAHCLQCICETASQCSMSATSGPFVISRPYWIDAGLPELNRNDESHEQHSDDEKFYDCITDQCCAAEAVDNFIKKYARDCNNDGRIDCKDYAMLHILGPSRCMREGMPKIHEKRYDMCMRKF